MSTAGEIIVIHMGQGGNRLGAKFWETIANEHGIDPMGSYHGHSDQQLEQINVFFNTSMTGRFIPRAVLADLEPNTVDAVRAGPYGQLFRPDNFVFGQTGSGNNWAKGYCTEGAELVDSVLDVIRREAEECTNLQGFIVIHSIGGGTGSGMGSLLITKLREEYEEKIITTFSIFPSPKVSDTVVEPYNAVLSINSLVDHADLVFCLDNEAFYDILFKELKISTPSYEDLNKIAAAALSDITASLRFPSKGENCLSSLQSMVTKLVPAKLPSIYDDEEQPSKSPLHFLSIALSPIRSVDNKSDAEVVRDLFSNNSIVTSGNPEKGKYLSAVGIFRGQETHTSLETFKTVIAELQKNSGNPECMMETGFIELPIPRKKITLGAALIINNTFMQGMLKRIAEQFTVMFRRKAYLHWYTGEGLDEMEFTIAESNLSDLITMYQNRQDAFEEEASNYENPEE